MSKGKANVYTRTGDGGSTGLFGGTRVDKDDCRVEAYGTLDELGASLSLAKTLAHRYWPGPLTMVLPQTNIDGWSYAGIGIAPGLDSRIGYSDDSDLHRRSRSFRC